MNKSKQRIIKNSDKKQTLTIYDPIFKNRIFVLLNYDEQDFVAFLNKHHVKDLPDKSYYGRVFAFVTHWENDLGMRDFCLVMKEFQWSIYEQGTLIHEIVHVVMWIFESNNIPFTIETQEFIAQMTGRIYEMIARKLVK